MYKYHFFDVDPKRLLLLITEIQKNHIRNIYSKIHLREKIGVKAPIKEKEIYRIKLQSFKRGKSHKKNSSLYKIQPVNREDVHPISKR